MFYFFNFGVNIRFPVKILIKRNVNISKDVTFSDDNRSVNNIGSLIKFT